jgi:hypothetical protein
MKLTIPSSLIRLSFAISFLASGANLPVRPKPQTADWCQCVIFVLNILGIKQIPGEYWTAASLAVPDEAGKTWMDYQGYSFIEQPDRALPQSGDLLVLPGGAEVITVQTWNGTEHLVPVPVDVWAGHIGIILKAETIEKDGNPYIQIHLLSANWGVNSHNLGVVGSCFNADESVFLVPQGYKKALFFMATDPLKMRERMVNRAERWALLGLAPSLQGSLDGFPISPSGFVSNVMEPVGIEPLVPTVTNIAENLIEVSPNHALPGDFVLFGEAKSPGLGVIAQRGTVEENQSWNGQIISMQPAARIAGPEDWEVVYEKGSWVRQSTDGKNSVVQFFRYRSIPAYPALMDFKTGEGTTSRTINFSFTLFNGGGKNLELSNLTVLVIPAEVNAGKPAEPENVVEKLTLMPDESFIHSGSITVKQPGNYQILLQAEDRQGTIQIPAKLDLTVE